MTIKAANPTEYMEQLPEGRKAAFKKLWEVVANNIPNGFAEEMSYGMPGFVVPHTRYPDGYHCDPKVALPFISMASQKNYISLYHSGIYADEKLMTWFREEYPKHSQTKLDMGKSCIRFKKPEAIPFELIGELCQKMTADEWIALYEANVKR